MQYFKQNRQKLVPEVKDFTSSMDEYRLAHPSKLSYRLWFWFHPTAYTIINYGLNVLGMILFLLVFNYFANKGWVIGMVITGLMFIWNCFQLFKKIEQWSMIKHVTFYDVYMRDYEVLEDARV